MNSTEYLVEKHFHKKPGENLEAIRERYRQIRTFHRDPLSAAILATSYYSLEELKMRLPRINEMLRNPFSREEDLHAVTGPIIAADGGPAEGAKAIQIYMDLIARGIIPEETRTFHIISLLSIASKKVIPLMEELVDDSRQKEEMKAAFHEASVRWLRAERERQVLDQQEENMAFALLVGMSQEVETLLEEQR